MATIFDVSKYILSSMGSMSTWKLQKLCYYSQAWALAWSEVPLFDEDFEAWANGPVCRELFVQHRGKFIVEFSDFSKGNPNNLTDDEKDTVDIIMRDYGKMEPYQLRELSHSEDPWIIARHGLPEGAKSQSIITKDSMGQYYGSL